MYRYMLHVGVNSLLVNIENPLYLLPFKLYIIKNFIIWHYINF